MASPTKSAEQPLPLTMCSKMPFKIVRRAFMMYLRERECTIAPPSSVSSRTPCQPSFPKGLQRQTQMALVNGRSKLAKILAEEGRWRRSPATAHQDSLAETGKLRTLREGTESIVFVQYGAQGPRPTIRMLTGRSGAATTS